MLAAQRKTFEALGCIVEDACPDLSDADSIFLTIRAVCGARRCTGSLLTSVPRSTEARSDWRDRGRARAHERRRGACDGSSTASCWSGCAAFRRQYEFIVCAVNQVPPFDATLDWPKEIDGVKMEHYVAWMKSAYWITATFRPAISVPAGFTTDGLPVGVQIVGRHHADFSVFQLAYAFEQETRIGQRRPPIG